MKKKLPGQKRELNILQGFLTSLYIATDITLDVKEVKNLLNLNSSLQRMHSIGNGEYNNEKLYKEMLLQVENRYNKKDSHDDK
jgi:hypothetical protein